MQPQQKKSNVKIILGVLAVVIVFSLVSLVGLSYYLIQNFDWNWDFDDKDEKYNWDDVHEISKFKSEEEFKAYMKESENLSKNRSQGFNRAFGEEVFMEESASDGMDKAAAPKTSGEGGKSVSRFSETNVQVQGIDEPDIVKTDGENIFLSNTNPYLYRAATRCVGEDCMIVGDGSKTNIVKALPIEEMEVAAEIENNGELLLNGRTLIVIGNRKVEAFDVSDFVSPKELWDYKYDDQIYLETSRLYGNDLYLVMRSYITQNSPCPIPLLEGPKDLEVSCKDIYHPGLPVPTDVTYSVLKVDTKTGDIKNQNSFIGSTGRSVVYMSQENLYITYSYNENQFEFLQKSLIEVGDGIFSEEEMKKIEDLKTLKISEAAKMTELQSIFESFYAGQSDGELEKTQEKINNRMEKYIKSHRREISSTGIVKFDLENLDLTSNGKVPGYPLNQFALDEYEGNLRFATTVEPYIYFYGVGVNSADLSTNDVYVLNNDLEKVGEVTGLGDEERIYSARFIGDKGYIVTFRETDPFYVLDLSNPEKPEMKGELKIPGYSAYLHPIDDNTILGVGKEDWKVKLSMFDVSDPNNPKEKDKFQLEDHWTEVEGNHHAFLLDSKHKAFFIPAGESGHIFSYANDKIEKVQTVKDINAKRALYINDYLYVVGDHNIKVFDENNWSELKNFEYAEKPKEIYPTPMEEPAEMPRVDVESSE